MGSVHIHNTLYNMTRMTRVVFGVRLGLNSEGFEHLNVMCTLQVV